MVYVLRNNLSIINSLLEKVKDYISCFDDGIPIYNYRHDSHNNQNYNSIKNSKNKHKKGKKHKKIDKKKQLSLENIMVLKIENDIIITMMGLRQDNCDKRVLLRKRKTEKSIIEKCLEENKSLERKNIKEYLPEEAQEMYNKELEKNNLQNCLEILKITEEILNTMNNENINNTQIKKVKKKTIK